MAGRGPRLHTHPRAAGAADPGGLPPDTEEKQTAGRCDHLGDTHALFCSI